MFYQLLHNWNNLCRRVHEINNHIIEKFPLNSDCKFCKGIITLIVSVGKIAKKIHI